MYEKKPEPGSVPLTWLCLINNEHLSQCAPNYYHVDLVRDFMCGASREQLSNDEHTALMTIAFSRVEKRSLVE